MPTRKATKPEGQTQRASPARKRRRQATSSAGSRSSAKKWSAEVTKKSDALDLEQGVFRSDSPEKIARSLKHSAEMSHRRKADPFRSALSMLTFYVNRAGTNLSASRRRTLTAAKEKLRQLFGLGHKLPIKRVK